MADKNSILWLDEPEPQDYPAALSYLSLLYDEARATQLVAQLKNAPLTRFKGKDILRASTLSLLGLSNAHVDKDIKKIKDGKSLSPILLVRDSSQLKLIVADGYHRVCAVYAMSEDEWIPCKIV